MTIEEVRSLLHAVPFQPFTIHLADGSTFDVPHSDFIALPSAGRTIVGYAPDARSHTVIDLLLVTKLDVHGPAPTKA